MTTLLDPRTAAGRALLTICRREFNEGNAASAESYILAIEAESAAPDSAAASDGVPQELRSPDGDPVRAALELVDRALDHLVPRDGSDASRLAVAYAIPLLIDARAALRLIVADDPNALRASPAAAPVDVERLAEAMKEVRSDKGNIDLEGWFDLSLDEEAAEVAAIYNRLAGQSTETATARGGK